MSENDNRPIPIDFYDGAAWTTSIVDYYKDNPKFHGKDVIEEPVKKLTESVEMVINIYGNYPDSVSSFLRQTTNPLFDSGEYEERVYNLLQRAAAEENDRSFSIMADSLLLIRNLFLQHKVVLPQLFQAQIDLVKEATPELRFLRFSEAVKNITKVHIDQVAGMIDSGNY